MGAVLVTLCFSGNTMSCSSSTHRVKGDTKEPTQNPIPDKVWKCAAKEFECNICGEHGEQDAWCTHPGIRILRRKEKDGTRRESFDGTVCPGRCVKQKAQ